MTPLRTLLIASLLPTAACSGSQLESPDAAASPGGADGSSAADAAPTFDAQTDAQAPRSARINELTKNPPGSDDDFEFIEVFGAEATDLSDHWLVVLEGDEDSSDTPGLVDIVFQVGTTDDSGLWFTGFVADEIENGSLTVLLVRDLDTSAVVVGTDLDVDNDGTLDSAPWSEELDAVALIDDIADIGYASVLLSNNADGLDDEFVGAARFPDGATEGDFQGWVRSNDTGDGLAGIEGASGDLCATCEEGSAASGQALLTPNLPNQIAP